MDGTSRACLDGQNVRFYTKKKRGKKAPAKMCFHKCFQVTFLSQLTCECFLFTNVLFCYSGSYLLLKMAVQHAHGRRPFGEQESHVLTQAFFYGYRRLIRANNVTHFSGFSK